MMNVETAGMEQRGCFPLTSLDKVEHLDLEVDLEQQVGLDVLLDVVLGEDLTCFSALGLLKIDAPRWEELKVLRVPEVFSKMVLW